MLIRMATADMLGDLGYRVAEAENADAALAILAEQEVTILMTDIGLPGVSGRDLAAEARTRIPGLPVIFASGEDGSGDGTQVPRTAFLTKPFGEDELRRAIAGVLI